MYLARDHVHMAQIWLHYWVCDVIRIVHTHFRCAYGAGVSHRAFSLADAKDQGLIVEQRRKPGGSGFYYILKNQHYEDGYLLKQYGRARLELVTGLPPLEELQRFNEVCLCLGGSGLGGDGWKAIFDFDRAWMLPFSLVLAGHGLLAAWDCKALTSVHVNSSVASRPGVLLSLVVWVWLLLHVQGCLATESLKWTQMGTRQCVNQLLVSSPLAHILDNFLYSSFCTVSARWAWAHAQMMIRRGESWRSSCAALEKAQKTAPLFATRKAIRLTPCLPAPSKQFAQAAAVRACLQHRMTSAGQDSVWETQLCISDDTCKANALHKTFGGDQRQLKSSLYCPVTELCWCHRYWRVSWLGPSAQRSSMMGSGLY